MRGKFIRRVTKHPDNPVQKVRKICGMSQAEFGAWLGFSEQHIRNVERGTPISDDLKNRIFILTGAWIDGKGGPPVAIVAEEGKCVPFTAELYQDYKGSLKGGGVVCGHVDTVLATLKFVVQVVREKAKANDNLILLDLLHFGLCKAARSLVNEFGLKEDIRRRIPQLAQSPIAERRLIGHYLCDFSDAQHLLRAFFS